MSSAKRWATSTWVKAPQPRLPSVGSSAPKIFAVKNIPADPPIVLVRTVASRQVIVAVNDTASAHQLRPEMTLAEARAICAEVRHVEHDAYKDAVALEALARWMMRFSPVVSLPFVGCASAHHSDQRCVTESHCLFLDVTGSDQVFHGLKNLIELILNSLARLRISAAVTIAPTPGAAWSLTFSPKHVGRIITQDELPDALNPLPPFTLRLDSDIVASLHHLGLERIEQIEKLPRELLPARFGEQLLLRLDQAFGRIAEPLVPIEPFTPIAARMDFEAPIDSLETIWLVFKRLIGEVVPELTKRGRGARELDLELFRPYDTPIHHTIRLSRPSRDPVNWFNLMRCVLEGLEERRSDEATERRRAKYRRLFLFPSSLRRFVASSLSYDRFVPSGFVGIRLSVRVSERISEDQIALLDHEQFDGEIELSHLIERLRVRMGQESIVQVELVESHLPEQSFQVKKETSSVALLQKPHKKPTADDQRFLPRAVRPLRLLQNPQEIRVMVTPSHDLDGKPISFTTPDGTVHRLRHALGPERIAGQWWTGRDKTRDYFDVEQSTGKRFWIFRVLESARWFLHGQFE